MITKAPNRTTTRRTNGRMVILLIDREVLLSPMFCLRSCTIERNDEQKQFIQLREAGFVLVMILRWCGR